MRIKNAGITDITIIKELAYAIWPECYKEILSQGQLQYMLQKIYSAEALWEQMVEQQHQFILVYEGNLPVGFADYAPKSLHDLTVYRLNKIYVLKHLQGKGYGKMLLQHVCDAALNNGATILELNVNRHNPTLNYYLKKGFTIDHAEDIEIGEGYFMNDYVMRMAL